VSGWHEKGCFLALGDKAMTTASIKARLAKLEAALHAASKVEATDFTIRFVRPDGITASTMTLKIPGGRQ
jgi:hypothetical protein